MLLLYLGLIISAKFLGPRKTSKVVDIIKIPADFSLRWINIFFTPAFVTLPLSSWIGAKEALTIAAVFVVGYFLATTIVAYFTIFLQKLLKKGRRSNVERAEELENLVQVDLGAGDSTAVDSRDLSGAEEESAHASRRASQERDLERIRSLQNAPEDIINEIAMGDEDSIEERYRRDQELSRQETRRQQLSPRVSEGSSPDVDVIQVRMSTNNKDEIIELPAPVAQPKHPFHANVSVKLNRMNKLFCKRQVLEQAQVMNREKKIAQFFNKHFDLLVFTVLFIVALPIYYAVGYEMPLQLDIAIFTFLFMIKVPPPNWKKYLHPVLCSVGLSWFFYFLFAIMKGQNFLDSLTEYKTGITYLKLFNHRTSDSPPGAGDVFATLMDVSIVSLSIPMYTYRMDLKRHFFALLPPILLMAFGCFFIYPPLCYHLGISTERSIGFAGRSVTLALGTPFVEALGGSVPLMAVTTVVSGIIGALSCQFVFGKILRIREDDYVTRGITLGVNCGAIATAHLLTIDPRAAAMSSLSFVLFGTVMVILASITPLAHLIQGWVGL
jgi:putative effector of murein hydrolase